jgi:hypothetical protein
MSHARQMRAPRAHKSPNPAKYSANLKRIPHICHANVRIPRVTFAYEVRDIARTLCTSYAQLTREIRAPNMLFLVTIISAAHRNYSISPPDVHMYYIRAQSI